MGEGHATKEVKSLKFYFYGVAAEKARSLEE